MGGGLPYTAGLLTSCAGQRQPTVTLCLLRAHKSKTPADPWVCRQKKRAQELTNKHHWNNQCFSVPMAFSPKHRHRAHVRGQPTEAGQPGALGPFHSQQKSPKDTLRNIHQKGLAVDASTTLQHAACPALQSRVPQ